MIWVTSSILTASAPSLMGGRHSSSSSSSTLAVLARALEDRRLRGGSIPSGKVAGSFVILIRSSARIIHSLTK